MPKKEREFEARSGYFPFEYYLLRAHFLTKLLENNPQCTECEYMHPLTYTPELYDTYISKEICPACPNFVGAYIEKAIPSASDIFFEELEDNDNGNAEK